MQKKCADMDFFFLINDNLATKLSLLVCGTSIEEVNISIIRYDICIVIPVRNQKIEAALRIKASLDYRELQKLPLQTTARNPWQYAQ